MGKRAVRQSTLTSPKPGWVPLRKAPFLFRATRSVGDVFLDGTSLDDLRKTLTELSGASEAHIDVQAQAFGFIFIEPVVEYSRAAPWVILAFAEEELPEPQPDPELLFNKNYRFVDDEHVRREKSRNRAIALATGVVWRQTMVREFNNAVEANQIALHARPTAEEPFQPVPPDVWPSYQISDWATGYAVGSDSSTLLSIHVAPQPSGRRGRVPDYDYDWIRAAVFRLIQSHNGLPDPANDKGRRTLTDLKHALEPSCENIFGKIPARSTLDKLVNRAVAEYRSR